MISVTPTPLEVESKRKSRFNLAKTRARTRHHGELSIIRATCMMLCRDVRSRKSASGLPRAMSSTSPSSSRISQHLSRFVYEPGVRSPRKPGGPSRAGNVQTTTPEKAAGSVPHTPSPKIKKSPGRMPATTRSKSSSGRLYSRFDRRIGHVRQYSAIFETKAARNCKRETEEDPSGVRSSRGICSSGYATR
jgi:hypothetical protein